MTATEELPTHPNPRDGMEDRQLLRTRGWQVASIDANAPPDRELHVRLTEQRGSAVVLSAVATGYVEEMHCHPKEEHVFLVWRGKLHVTGLQDGEDVVLGPGQFVHIDANYYYELHNPGPEQAVYYQVRTLPSKQPKRRKVLFTESAPGKRATRQLATP